MQHSMVDELAERFGIAAGYSGSDGSWTETPFETKRSLLKGLGISSASHVGPDRSGPAPSKASRRCFLPKWLLDRPAWGITGQLYELRSQRSWGIGDFADLEALCFIAARRGVDFIGLTPIHAPFLADPDRCSPFSPSNRRFLNPLYIAVDRVEGYQPSSHAPEVLSDATSGSLVDYRRVAKLKLSVLKDIWRIRDSTTAHWMEFERFRDGAPVLLRRHALFEALSAHLVEKGHGAGWRDWPHAFHDPEGAAVKAFSREAAHEVEFHLWLQFLADRQLAKAARAAREAGMRIGLYLDFAVGDEPDGSATWSALDNYVAGATIGAPPDYFSALGQDWGIAALSPLALEGQGYVPFRELIADAARHAGALRIDHVMALQQLFLVPEGAAASAGAHLRYPFDDLLCNLAEVSRERQLLLIGEDLGHVPEGFRDAMQDAAILAYRILYFEQSERGFLPAREYPRRSIASLSTHDLPTFRGWWRGHDVELRCRYGLIDSEAAERQRANRINERRALARLLSARKPISAEWRAAIHLPDQPPPDSLTVAVHEFLSLSNSVLAGVRIADLVGEDEPTNLPGTSRTYPNWRRRMAVTLEEMEETPLFLAVTHSMAARRPRS